MATLAITQSELVFGRILYLPRHNADGRHVMAKEVRLDEYTKKWDKHLPLTTRGHEHPCMVLLRESSNTVLIAMVR